MTILQNKPQQLEDRMLTFTVDVIKLCKALGKSQENQIISNQLVRSASAIGANYAEANNAASRMDFRSKIFIAKKEAAETRYWLTLINRVNQDADTSTLIDETTQLLMILQKIISTMKNVR